MYPHFVDIIRIGHITSYLARNVCHVLQVFILVMDVVCFCYILHSFVLVVDIICIGRNMSYLSLNFRPISHIYSYIVRYWFNQSHLLFLFIFIHIPTTSFTVKRHVLKDRFRFEQLLTAVREADPLS